MLARHRGFVTRTRSCSRSSFCREAAAPVQTRREMRSRVHPKGTGSCKGELPLAAPHTNPGGRQDQRPPPTPDPIDVLWGCRVQASQLLGAIP